MPPPSRRSLRDDPAGPSPAAARRRPFRDNPRLILAGIAVLAAVLAAILALANRTPRFSPDFLTEFVLYALSAADLTMLACAGLRAGAQHRQARRRAAPGAAVRAVPRQARRAAARHDARAGDARADRRQRADSHEHRPLVQRADGRDPRRRPIRSRATTTTSGRCWSSDHAARIARALVGLISTAPDVRTRFAICVAPDVTLQRVQMVEVYRVGPSAGSLPSLEPVVDVAAPTLPPGYSRAAADRLAAQALARLDRDAHRSRRSAPRAICCMRRRSFRRRTARTTGVVVATDYLTGDLATRSRRMTQAFESYNQLRVLKRPLTGLLPVVLPDGDAAHSGRRDVDGARIWPSASPVRCRCSPRRRGRSARAGWISASSRRATTSSASLVEAFNTMAGELATSRRKVDRSTIELAAEASRGGRAAALHRDDSRAHHHRRGVSVDAAGAITTINSAAGAAARASTAASSDSRRTPSSTGRTSSRSARCSAAPGGPSGGAAAQEITIPRDGQELHLAVVATALVGDSGAPEGLVLVLDDVTPLIRAQKVAAWREVARRLAHEIKNPLTPIQLCAERLRRHFAGGPSRRARAGRRMHGDDRRRGRIAEGTRR